ncbi:MAG: hypothetical protein ACLUVG_02545 [Phocaeicola vulgatus]
MCDDACSLSLFLVTVATGIRTMMYCKNDGGLRDYQQEDEASWLFKEWSSIGVYVVQMPTGTGRETSALAAVVKEFLLWYRYRHAGVDCEAHRRG